jgi:amidase
MLWLSPALWRECFSLVSRDVLPFVSRTPKAREATSSFLINGVSISATTESALYGNTCTPWRAGYSAGGSTGGGMASVIAGIVPIAHGTDAGGSIRVPASWCGGVGLKPSRGRISWGPVLDELGYGLAQNFVVVKTVRDAAAMLDCLAVPQPGDPFVIPKPNEPYAALIKRTSGRLRIGWSTDPVMGMETDAGVRSAIGRVARVLAEMGHELAEESPQFGGLDALRSMMDVFFFGFDLRLASYAKRTGREISRETLEPVTFAIYEHAKAMKPGHFLNAMASINATRRKLGAYSGDTTCGCRPPHPGPPSRGATTTSGAPMSHSTKLPRSSTAVSPSSRFRTTSWARRRSRCRWRCMRTDCRSACSSARDPPMSM